MADLFKIASKRKYRFSFKGQLTVEDLWDLSVEDLDRIYKDLKAKQKNETEDSLLGTVTKQDKILANKIEIIKAIVMDKLAAKERAAKVAKAKAQNQRILEIMADKADAELKEKSIDELQSLLVSTDPDDED